jgi:hypothetical protein
MRTVQWRTCSQSAEGTSSGKVASGARCMWPARRLKVELSDATLNTIAYDGDGQRRQYEDSAGLRKSIWDGENFLLETDSGGTTNRGDI